MNSAQTVDNKIINWKTEGHTKAELAVLIAEACMGFPYVWGSRGELDTPKEREVYFNRSSVKGKDKENIKARCQVLNGSKSSCDGCGFYPNSPTRMFDCRGFTYWVLKQCGVTINGAGATSQYNDNSNWLEKGEIKDMPLNAVCCVFQYNSSEKNMQHTGLHIGGGQIIHCSGKVKQGSTKDKTWSHYAIPKGMQEKVDSRPTLKRGSKGEWVTLAQTKLYQAGYGLGKAGIDGDFGKATETAVKNFQLDHDLTPDGVIGQKTWSALDGTEPAILYTVTINGLTGSQADALIRDYPGSKKTEERG